MEVEVQGTLFMVWYVASGLNGWLLPCDTAMSTAARASARASRVSSRLAKILLCSCRRHKTERGAGRGGQGGREGAKCEGGRGREGESVGVAGAPWKRRGKVEGGEREVGKVGVTAGEPAVGSACKGIRDREEEPREWGKRSIAGDSPWK